MSFLGEIKRRKVFQVAAVYAVVAWLIIQIVDVVGEPLTLPSWIDAVVIVLLAVGFPIAVILAWAFDLTPQGIKADSEIQGSSLSVQVGGQPLNYLLQGLVLVAVGFLVVDQYLLEPRVSSIAVSSVPTVAGPLHVNRFDYELAEGQSFRNSGRRIMALSPDGRHFVYSANDGLYLRTMGELDARLLPGTEMGSRSPAFSPDGQSVVYYDLNLTQLIRIAISGGAPVVIGPVASNVHGVSWEADGTILIGQPEGILRVSANGGTPELIIEAEDGTQVYGPRLLPDGDTVLFSVGPPRERDAVQIVVQSLSTGERTVLVEGGNDARYLPTGHLVYALGEELLAVAFDPNSLTVSGGAVPLVQGVMRGAGSSTGAANYSVSEDGTLVYVRGGVVADARTLVWVDREGREEPIDAPPRSYTSPRISPDGTRVALNARDQELDIWTWDLARETLTRLTFDPGDDTFPVWSPDGLRIAYSSWRDRAGPDGHWLAYTSDESGSAEVYVRPFPDVDAGGRWQVSAGGGTQPLWSRNGSELFYRNGEALMAVSVQTDPSFTIGNPQALFEGRQYLGEGQGGRSYDVSPSDGRFLMIKEIEDTSAVSRIIVVQNWFEELKRLAPIE